MDVIASQFIELFLANPLLSMVTAKLHANHTINDREELHATVVRRSAHKDTKA